MNKTFKIHFHLKRPKDYVKGHLPIYMRLTIDKDNRATIGFSMKGLQTQHITNSNPHLFAYIGVLSMGLMDSNRFGNYNKEEHLQQIKALSKAGPKLYWLGVLEKTIFSMLRLLTYENVTMKRVLNRSFTKVPGRIPGQTGVFI